jgi:hypothetical protein
MRQLVRPVRPLRCELCGGVMKFVRRVAAPGTDLSMALYQCEQCRHTVTKSIEEDEREGGR